MFTFNLTSLLPKKLKHFEPLRTLTRKEYESYKPPSANEIRKTIEKLSRCSHCHFLVFDNYWTNKEGEKSNLNLCSTCGHKI